MQTAIQYAGVNSVTSDPSIDRHAAILRLKGQKQERDAEILKGTDLARQREQARRRAAFEAGKSWALTHASFGALERVAKFKLSPTSLLFAGPARHAEALATAIEAASSTPRNTSDTMLAVLGSARPEFGEVEAFAAGAADVFKEVAGD